MSGGVLIEETPLNLTAAQVQKGSPDATNQLQAAGADSENQRVLALVAEFAGDAPFLQAAIADKSMTVEKAKAKKYDETKATVQTLVAENTKLKTEGVVGFAAGDKPAAAGVADVSNPEALEAEAVALWNSDASLRAEFAGIYTSYLAGFKAEPHLYRKAKK